MPKASEASRERERERSNSSAHAFCFIPSSQWQCSGFPSMRRGPWEGGHSVPPEHSVRTEGGLRRCLLQRGQTPASVVTVPGGRGRGLLLAPGAASVSCPHDNRGQATIAVLDWPNAGSVRLWSPKPPPHSTHPHPGVIPRLPKVSCREVSMLSPSTRVLHHFHKHETEVQRDYETCSVAPEPELELTLNPS